MGYVRCLRSSTSWGALGRCGLVAPPRAEVPGGVFSAQDEGVQFHEARLLCPADIAAVQRAARTRVLRPFVWRGLIPPEAAAEMRQWHHEGGFSLDAAVRIEATDRKGLEPLLRYCARPIYAGERLESP